MNRKKLTETSINLESLETPSPAVPWWNTPVLGEGSLLEKLLKKFRKPEVSESALFLHNREMMDVKVFAKAADAIDNEKFGNPEFLLLVKIKYLLAKGLDEYAGLYDSVQLLQVAIAAKDSFIAIAQTELLYRASKQQDFYEFIEKLLSHPEDKAWFRLQVQNKLAETLPQIKTDEGKVALQAYSKHLDTISSNELGLKLLALFKAYHLADYSILRIISEIVQSFSKKDLHDLKEIAALVMVNYNTFEKLGQIIGVAEHKNTPDTYARMIQYIGLIDKYALSFPKFEELMVVMRKWYRCDRTIIGIREQYPRTEYKQPKEFSAEIPGTDLYLKYQNWLTDKKTGRRYIEFEETSTAA
jgi:hypothetical protein